MPIRQVNGQGVGFNLRFQKPVDPAGGDVTALGFMDDKTIIFKQRRTFAFFGDGPLPTGAQDTFSKPQLVTTDMGCDNQRSLESTDLGLMLESEKGIYLLDRSLQSVYIGADVEGFNDLNITSGVLRTSDFALVNEALSLAGQGRVDIGNQTLDMKLAPGKRQDDGGSNLKVKVHGPWNNIKYSPDFEDIIKGGLRDLILGDTKDKEPTLEGEIANQLLDAIFGSKRK